MAVMDIDIYGLGDQFYVLCEIGGSLRIFFRRGHRGIRAVLGFKTKFNMYQYTSLTRYKPLPMASDHFLVP